MAQPDKDEIAVLQEQVNQAHEAVAKVEMRVAEKCHQLNELLQSIFLPHHQSAAAVEHDGR